MLAVLLLSFVAVHVLAPLGQHFGHPFNEAGRRQRRRAKALQSLRDTVEQLLGESLALRAAADMASTASAPFSSADLELDALAEKLRTDQIEQAAEDTDAFLRRAAAGSRVLLLRACAARAAQLAPHSEAQLANQRLAQAGLLKRGSVPASRVPLQGEVR